jgi:dipeptidyl-peptidase-4
MKRFLLLLLLVSFSGIAQNLITIDDIWNGTFRPKYLYGITAMPKSDKYSKIDIDRVKGTYDIVIYDYKTQKKVKKAFSTQLFPELGYFNYQFSADENKILLGSKMIPIYRHSQKGIYYVYDRDSKDIVKIDDENIQEPSFSPNNEKIAFVKDNNLYIRDLTSNETIQITSDGKKNEIINGIPDWVYEEEFGYSRAYEWNQDGTQLAYVKFDESEVPEFSMMRYGENLYPKVETFKYPKAGEKNSKVALYIYNVSTQETTEIDLGEYEYIPRIKWAKADCLTAITLNRHQNVLKLHKYNTVDQKDNVIITRKSDTYIDIEATDNLTFLQDGRIIWSSEQDGWNHLYLYDEDGKLINQITKGNWEVTDFYGYDEILDRLYYQSTETGSINRAIYSIKLNGKNKKLLSERYGTSSAEFSANHKYFINTFSNIKTPYTFTVNLAETGKVLSTIIDNKALVEKLKNYKLPKKVFTHYKAADGTLLNGYIIMPKTKDKTKQMPVLIYQYSGPNVQTVRNAWHSSNDYFHYLLAQKGYIVISVDPRGTGGKGAQFKKSTYKQLGKLELEDIATVAKYVGEAKFVDAKRIGIWGWSFGGYMSSNAILRHGDTFSMAIAVAPVTNWRFYDSVYTERFMQTPQENPEGYDNNSPLSYTDGLKGKFLLIHGSGDDNVHVQNSMRLALKLQENDQAFDQMIYTDKNHGIYGKKTRNHLFKKMLRYIENNL